MTRGTKIDMGLGLFNKSIILDLYFNGYSFTVIELKTNYSKEAVDLYIQDFQRIEIFWQNDIKDPDKISHLVRFSKRVVQQYIDLLPSNLKNSFSKNDENSN